MFGKEFENEYIRVLHIACKYAASIDRENLESHESKACIRKMQEYASAMRQSHQLLSQAIEILKQIQE